MLQNITIFIVEDLSESTLWRDNWETCALLKSNLLYVVSEFYLCSVKPCELSPLSRLVLSQEPIPLRADRNIKQRFRVLSLLGFSVLKLFL